MVNETDRRYFLRQFGLTVLAATQPIFSQDTQARKLERLLQELPYRTSVKLQDILKDTRAKQDMEEFLPFDKVNSIWDEKLRESMYELFAVAYQYHAGSSQNESDMINNITAAADSMFLHYERYQLHFGEKDSMAIRPEITRLYKFALDRLAFTPERAGKIKYLSESYSNLLKDYEILKSNRPIPRADERISRK